jgi:hypothetical protein
MGGQSNWKLHVAVFADTEQRVFSNDPKVSFFHAFSLRRSCWRSSPVNFKLRHYQGDSGW